MESAEVGITEGNVEKHAENIKYRKSIFLLRSGRNAIFWSEDSAQNNN
jgi:hypothetical protein